jgi:hypothetical protein
MELAKRLRPITKEEAIANYEELVNLTCNSISKYARIGLKTLDYFFLGHRLKAKTRSHISFVDVLKNKEKLDYLDDKIYKVRGKNINVLTDNEILILRYSLFQLYFGSINQFRPTEAKRVYCELDPKVGILDFSAGWGGRCLGAISCGIPYIGIDANKNLEPAYKKMIESVSPNANVKMIFAPSETIDFSKFKYDLVFTSPPYFFIEEYEKMPDYGSKDAFIDKFFRPVVVSSWKYLKWNGHMALNMPIDMYNSVRDLLPKLHKRMYLPVRTRHPRNAARRQDIGEVDKGQRKETIYIWKKIRGSQTRKRK